MNMTVSLSTLCSFYIKIESKDDLSLGVADHHCCLQILNYEALP